MAERLTIKNSDNTYSQPTDTTFEIVFNRLGELEDILEKYGIESVEELDSLIANYKISSILTEDRIKEIAVNEQRKIMQSMVKEIVEKECNQLYTECDTWKRACELACDVILRFTDGCPCKADYFYQQAKKEKDENKN